MLLSAMTLAMTTIVVAASAEERGGTPERVAPPIVRDTVPALADYTDGVLFGDLWKRPDLTPRDRSLVTVAALIAGNHVPQMTGHFNRALDNGVRPEELSAVVTHLAFYSGWPNAMSATGVVRDVFATRHIETEEVPEAPIVLEPGAEARRAASVNETVGPVAPALAAYTNDVLFGDLWRRPDLTPRDRSLVTIAALIAGGKAEQLPYHLRRGMENGLTRSQIEGTITHLAFYAGWPNAMSAVPVAAKVFEGSQAATAD